METKRVVVTGLGTINAVGNNVKEFWENLVAGKCGIDKITAFDPSAFKAQVAGEVKNFNPENYGIEKKEVRRMGRFMMLGVAAAKEAIEDSGYDIAADPESIGVLVGSGIGGLEAMEANMNKMLEGGPGRISPFLIPMMIADSAAGIISIKSGAKGPNLCTTTACASGTHSIGDAFHLIKTGVVKAMIAGGTEAAITPLGLGGFCAAQSLCTDHNDNPKEASRPFDATRSGFVMGEGAGILILEELGHALARGAKIYAEIVGYGATGDAYHVTAPAPEGEGGARGMKMALDEAGIKPEEVTYINAHGTSTELNDKNETTAIKTIFGAAAKKVKISSTKGATGHCLGAAGGIEAVVAVKAIETNTIPPTINLKNPDPECDLDYTPLKKVTTEVKVTMSNSFGFGGHNAIIVFKKYVK